MTSAVRDAASSRRARWRFAAVLAVLAGLFFMHGMSAAQGCHGGPGAMTSMTSASVAAPVESGADSTSVMAPGMDGGSAAGQMVGPGVGHGAAMSGDSCVPLRAEESGAAVLMLLAVVLAAGGLAVCGRSLLTSVGRWMRLRALIPRGGAVLLVSLCISRT